MEGLTPVESPFAIMPICDEHQTRCVPSDNLPLATCWSAWSCPVEHCETVYFAPLLGEVTDA